MASGIFILFYLSDLVNFEIQWFASFRTGDCYTTFISKGICFEAKAAQTQWLEYFFAGK